MIVCLNNGKASLNNVPNNTKTVSNVSNVYNNNVITQPKRHLRILLKLQKI